MQGHRDLPVVAELIMDELVPLVSAQYGAFYLAEESDDGPELRLVGSYGYPPTTTSRPTRYAFGRTLVGQAARSRRTITVDELPPDYVTISWGCGPVVPTALVLLPIVVEAHRRATGRSPSPRAPATTSPSPSTPGT
ncbi:histidine kinase OS=Streptomyces alboniger OX=132473 GN=CP975_25985 PE=4 SV=1 [Streptomyces alboniger]